MNTEQKAKAYDEALDKAKKELQTCGSTDCDAARQIFRFFPTLRESKDERIRKDIINLIYWLAGNPSLCSRYYRDRYDDMLAWLEKQKETANSFTNDVIEVRSFQRGIAEGRRLERQKECVADSSKTSANEDESIRKFLVDYFTSYKIGNVATKLNGVRIDDILAYLEKQKEQKPAQTVEEKEYVRTLKGLVSDFIRDSGGGITDVEYYQNICDWLDGRHIEQKPVEYLSKDKVYAIMSKLTKLSTSNLIPFNSPEYKKINEITSDIRSLLDYPIEQKPAECNCACFRDERFEVIEKAKKDILEKTNITENKLSLEPSYLDSILMRVWQVGWLNKKPAEWDDYTKTNLGRAIQIIKDARGTLHGYQTDDGIYECDKAIEALEHFLYRGLEIEKSADWSEEDEKMLKWIEDILLIADDDLNDKLNGKVSQITDSTYSSIKICIAKCFSWLKLLRNRVGKESLQPHWKPSEDEECKNSK